MKKNGPYRTFCVAPMMQRTDKHFRHLLRMLSRRAMLYTEMIPARAVLYGNKAHLSFEEFQHPLALQLGGSNPGEMADCARIAEELGYDEVNINVGCPSSRVRKGSFGACLMKTPQLVADCVAAMSANVTIPITVKCRIGIEPGSGSKKKDDAETLDELCHFVDSVASGGCNTFIVHARKAVLDGLSPKQNRKIPRLRYDLAKSLKLRFPRLEIILNGGIETLLQAKSELADFDGVMLGRAAYKYPILLAHVDSMFYGEKTLPVSHEDVIARCLGYLIQETRRGVPPSLITRHLLNWFRGHHGAKGWRRYLSESLPRCDWQVDLAELATKIPGNGSEC